MEIKVGKTILQLVIGDITDQETEAVVNAANSSLLGGSGVDGAIHRVGGPKILEECKQIRASHGKCPTGEAVITTGGNLKADYVIHTVGPIWRGRKVDEPELLKNGYQNSLKLAKEKKIKTISFPSISTGAYGYPTEKASLVALETVLEYITDNDDFDEVRFVLFSDEDYKIYIKSLQQLV